MGRRFREEGGGAEGDEVLPVEVEEGGTVVEQEGAEEESVEEVEEGGVRDEVIGAGEAIGVWMEFVRVVEVWKVD